MHEIKSPSEPNSKFVSAAIRVPHLLIPIFLRLPSTIRENFAAKLRNSACLRSGRRILEDCTAEILLVELGEILDAAVEWID